MSVIGTNPVILNAVNDRFATPCKIAAIIWEGATSSGDRVEVNNSATGLPLWAARTDTSQTYLGVSFDEGIRCDKGFGIGVLSSGRVLVYIKDVF